jgi:hypothetical protein
MSRTPKPLRIAVLAPLDQWQELHDLGAQGHEVVLLTGWESYDVILGPTCWLMDDAHRKYVKDAIAEARRRRYPKEAREQPE